MIDDIDIHIYGGYAVAFMLFALTGIWAGILGVIEIVKSFFKSLR